MHQRVLHILAYASDQVNVVDKQFFEKALRDVSLVRHEFSEDLFRKLGLRVKYTPEIGFNLLKFI